MTAASVAHDTPKIFRADSRGHASRLVNAPEWTRTIARYIRRPSEAIATRSRRSSAARAGSLFAIAYGVLQNRAEAEDVVQDAFVKAWKSRWRVRDPEKFPAWLATIARNRARDIARGRRTVPLLDRARGSGR